MKTIALLFFCLLPINLHVQEHIAIIEVNAFYDEWGRLVFDQMIFRDSDSSVVDWRLLKTSRVVYSEVELPLVIEEYKLKIMREWKLKEWPPNTPVPFVPQWKGISGLDERKKVYTFKDNDVYRRITFDTIVYTHTQYDPELVAREDLPKEKRRGLRQQQ